MMSALVIKQLHAEIERLKQEKEELLRIAEVLGSERHGEAYEDAQTKLIQLRIQSIKGML